MPKPYSALLESQVAPEPTLQKLSRRQFSAGYTLLILALADAYLRGELSVPLRREKPYSSQVQQWGRELGAGGVGSLSKSVLGSAARRNPEERRIEKLKQERVCLNRRVKIAAWPDVAARSLSADESSVGNYTPAQVLAGQNPKVTDIRLQPWIPTNSSIPSALSKGHRGHPAIHNCDHHSRPTPRESTNRCAHR